MAEKYFGSLNSLKRNRERKFAVKSAEDLYFSKEVQQVHAIFGKPVAGYKENNRSAMNILSHILGDGSSSRLFQSLRERNGITYQVNSFLNSFYDISTFGIYFSTNPKNYSKAQKLVFAELEKFVKRPITQKEVDRAKAYIKGNILMGLENTTNRMLRMAQSFIYFNRIKSIEETIMEIDSLTLEQLHSLSCELFIPETFIKTIISPDKKPMN
jgi:predicted Zn-dependent peptidase